MKDVNGLYYYPDPTDTKTRVYVREGANGVEFRLWHAEKTEVWDKHDWIALEVINAAATLYKQQGKTSNPLLLYDPNVARALIKAGK